VVLNACELRTGSSFRYGTRESGWRYGRIADNDVSVAEAVGASAAYPAILPALDRVYDFVDRRAQHTKSRVIIADGGVF